MVGLFLVAGVALLLSSMKGQAAPSVSESTSTDPAKAGKRVTRPGFFGSKTGAFPIPPTGRRELGLGQVGDARYDAKGGLDAVAVKKGGLDLAVFGWDPFGGDKMPSKTPVVAKPVKVAPGSPVKVMPPARAPQSMPSRFRIPTIPSTKGR